jgi:hypothetical protein
MQKLGGGCVASAFSSVTPLRIAADAVDDTRYLVVPSHRIQTSDGKVRARAAGAHIKERVTRSASVLVAVVTPSACGDRGLGYWSTEPRSATIGSAGLPAIPGSRLPGLWDGSPRGFRTV